MIFLNLAHSHDPCLFKIGVGGVDNKESFNSKLELGASLVQIYTSFIYQGPQISKEIVGLRIFHGILNSYFVILFLVGAISFLKAIKENESSSVC